MAASTSADFISLNSASSTQLSRRKVRRKRINKNKKKNWTKCTDIADVEGFLDDVRLQERAVGGLISEKSDDTLFFVDTGNEQKDLKLNKGKTKPLHIDLVLQSTSQVPPPKDILSHQIPNAKKLRRQALRQEKLEAQGIVPRSKRLLQARLLQKSLGKPSPIPSTGPRRKYYDIWSKNSPLNKDLIGKDSWYLQQTKKQRIKRPDWLQTKPSQLAAVEVISPGGSYNPTFESHQALLLKAHEVELKKLKEEEKLNSQLSVPVKEDIATEETTFQELCQGLLEDSEGEEEEKEKEKKHPVSEDTPEDRTVPVAVGEKKTEKQRKREKVLKEKVGGKLQAEKEANCKKQELFRLRSIKAVVKQREEELAQRKKKRMEKRESDATKPKRLGRLKYQELDPDVQLSTELSGCLRTLKPEGSILRDRFKSLQKRNLIEPRERAK
ncbi:ribosome biogenesis protein NOP53 [Protopterus annectens]|uniref:ribosome biogenesis protein NOP53 n=1 Tax=Protopterus annectens TaxID=7888 RepID=UPI001CFBF904|nr:ribosome biogenesis protein NOP53 [Protopterus annectens]